VGKTVLLIDFDPQCNLSLAVLGEKRFVDVLPAQNVPYGETIHICKDTYKIPVEKRCSCVKRNTLTSMFTWLSAIFEDANVLIRNSLWLNVPLGDLDRHEQVVSLRDRKKWADNQVEQIKLLKNKFAEAANNIVKLCV
jgi:chromosome partitioning protein